MTGMPLKFYYTNWAKVIFDFLGGAEVARTLHHFGAMITFLYFGLHLASSLFKRWQAARGFRDPATGRSKWTRL